MSNFIKVSVWFILFIVVSSVGFSMLNAANTIENIIGFIISESETITHLR